MCIKTTNGILEDHAAPTPCQKVRCRNSSSVVHRHTHQQHWGAPVAEQPCKSRSTTNYICEEAAPILTIPFILEKISVKKVVMVGLQVFQYVDFQQLFRWKLKYFASMALNGTIEQTAPFQEGDRFAIVDFLNFAFELKQLTSSACTCQHKP